MSTDGPLLVFSSQIVPGIQVVGVLLGKGIRSVDEFGIFIPNNSVFWGLGSRRILGAIDESNDGAAFEVAEADRLIDDAGPVAEKFTEFGGNFVDHGHVIGPNVQEEIARSGGSSVLGSDDRLKVNEFFRWLNRWKQELPGAGPQTKRHAEIGLWVANV